MKKTLSALMVAVSAVAMSANANALEYNPYAGAEYNYSLLTGESRNFNSGKVFVGSQYNENFGVEAFYQKSTEDTKAHQPKLSYEAYGLDLMGYLPLGCDQVVSLIGTAGLGYYDFQEKEKGERTDNEGTWGYRLGAGAEYNIDENVAVRATARWVKLNERIYDSNDLWEYSIGARYNF